MTSKAAGSQMPPKRGEGAAAKLAELKEEIQKVEGSWIGLWQTGEHKQTIIKFPKSVVLIHKEKMDRLAGLAALETSSPSALIAAVEAMSGFSVSHFPDGSIVTDKEGEYVDREDVLKLLRAAPTEEVA